MKSKVFIVVLLFAVCPVTYARIGETYDELVKRYGEPTSTMPSEGGLPQTYSFAFDRFRIRVFLLSGRSAYENFMEFETPVSTHQQGGARISDTISTKTKDMVLGANSRGKRWESATSISWLGEQWERGKEHPFTKSTLLNGWKLSGEPIFCSEERLSRITKGGWCEITVYSQEWSDFFGAVARKWHEKEVKDSGL